MITLKRAVAGVLTKEVGNASALLKLSLSNNKITGTFARCTQTFDYRGSEKKG